jgi:hypothetical protein
MKDFQATEEANSLKEKIDSTSKHEILHFLLAWMRIQHCL